MNIGSLAFAALAVVAGAVLLGLHDLSSDQFLAILTGAGIHVSAVTVPKLAGPASSSVAPGEPPAPAAGP